MKIAPIAFLLLMTILLNSCGDKIEEFSGFLKSETINLLMFENIVNTSSPEVKVWTFTDYEINGESVMTDCLDSMRVQFVFIDSLETEGNQLFYLNNPNRCLITQLCNENPELCDFNAAFCEDNINFCESVGVNVIFTGSWTIPDPPVENGKVNTIIINGPMGEIEYTFRYLTSKNLELVATIEEEGEITEIFQKYIAE